MSFLLKTLTTKREVDTAIRDTLDKVLVLRFGRASEPVCLQLDDIVKENRKWEKTSLQVFKFMLMFTLGLKSTLELAKSSREISKFAVIALVDIDAEEVQVYAKYFDIVLIPSTVFFFNAHHMKMDSGTADHTKWVGSFQCKQDFIDVVEAIFRGAMKGKLIVSCPLPPEQIPRFQLLFKDL